MDEHARAVVEECTAASDESRMPFPEVLLRLSEVGVERYHADLMRSEKVYYRPDGASAAVACAPIAAVAPLHFSAGDVEAAVRATQAQAITYHEFCERIVAAGCVGYLVTLSGRRAVYYGRTGESYVEPFPPSA